MKGFLSGQWFKAAGKCEFALTEGALQAGDKLATKDTAQHLHRQKERVARADPALVVKGQTTRRDYAMDMRVVLEVLAPGVEHTEEANLRSEMLRVGSHLQQSRGAGAEQEIVHDFLVLQSQPREFVR
jgi:hypothetical protein